MPTEPPSSKDSKDSDDREESRVERALREIVRKVIEAGYERLSEGPENVRHLMSELKLPKETLGALFGSGELASLLYAEINRRQVADIIASSTAAHRAIADALVAGRRKATLTAVQSHLDDVERRMIDQLL